MTSVNITVEGNPTNPEPEVGDYFEDEEGAVLIAFHAWCPANSDYEIQYLDLTDGDTYRVGNLRGLRKLSRVEVTAIR